jgi:hypothetical protein
MLRIILKISISTRMSTCNQLVEILSPPLFSSNSTEKQVVASESIPIWERKSEYSGKGNSKYNLNLEAKSKPHCRPYTLNLYIKLNLPLARRVKFS